MNKKVRYFLLSVLIIIVAAILFSGCYQGKNSSNKIMTNEKIIQSSGFIVNSDSTEMNTSAKGTVFVKGVEGIPEQVQIVALLEIDPDDWGGVVFYIPDGWQISSITSSYPENETRKIPADYVTRWTTADPEYELNTMIEVGRDRNYIPTGGGMGTVVIDLILDENAIQPETFNIMIAVGSDEKDGTKIGGTDYISLEIPIGDH